MALPALGLLNMAGGAAQGVSGAIGAAQTLKNLGQPEAASGGSLYSDTVGQGSGSPESNAQSKQLELLQNVSNFGLRQIQQSVARGSKI